MIQTLVDRDSINDETVVIRKIYVSSGQYVAAGSLILEYETTKTTVESNASSAGVVTLEVKESDEVDVGALLYQISSEPPAVGATAADGAVPQAVASRIAAGEALQATRDGLALLSQPRLSRDATAHAEKCGIGVGAFPAGKWVTRADVESLAHGHQTISDQAIERIAVGRFDGRDTENTRGKRSPKVPHTVSTSTLRKRTEARNLSESNSHGAVSTLGLSLPIAGARLVKPPPLFSIGIVDLVAFEASRLLKRFPELNAFYVDDKRIGHFDEINVGVAFDSGSNLKVLAIHSADKKGLCDIQLEIVSLLELYESDKPIPEELLTSATVTLSDVSATDVDFMQPLLNAQQGLIVGITRARHGFSLYASFDHRVTEGLRVARFLEQLSGNVKSHFRGAMAKENLVCSACEKRMEDELALGHRGLIRIALASGEEGLLCRSCFEGV